MDHLLANILLALGVASTPNPVPDFKPFGETAVFTVAVDLNSVQLEPRVGGWNVKSTIKRTLHVEIDVKGKTKKGSYYLEQTTTRCMSETFTIDKSVLHSKDGEVLATKTEPFVMSDPHVPGNFVTEFVDLLCNTAKTVKPPLIV